ncbi:mechanosensitive ion channel domain-containing protein [Sinomicrobium weinanense]|uniref:Mechanosensitive ion channel n=1 Tax=Sinomicrobium weinanense TaxID=2842200 RepID=A0A926JT05_9FLAO|nr:mechanosensitive ion channel domain-containing protein [Sinomicrobium weinanense]MBC9796980.1 mechanosensitive ion channel [Sinomicrobium weinanense]MBU3122181.1 mechanosensitive ion channel family protein [Sinomicrobium weinanense]
MNDFLALYQSQLLYSAITVILLLLLKIGLFKIIRKVGKISNYNDARTSLILKYANFAIVCTGIVALSIIWNVRFEDLGIFLSSIFAVIGVALFAQWSILSNITAGIILFFTFPFKIGDRIQIQDKDFPTEAFIEDITAFHLLLRTDEGELITYPNNLLLQKGVRVVNSHKDDDGGQSL